MWLSSTVRESVKDGLKSFIITNRAFGLGVVEYGKVKGFVKQASYLKLFAIYNLKVNLI